MKRIKQSRLKFYWGAVGKLGVALQFKLRVNFKNDFLIWLEGSEGSVQFSSVAQSCPTLCDPMIKACIYAKEEHPS